MKHVDVFQPPKDCANQISHLRQLDADKLHIHRWWMVKVSDESNVCTEVRKWGAKTQLGRTKKMLGWNEMWFYVWNLVPKKSHAWEHVDGEISWQSRGEKMAMMWTICFSKNKKGSDSHCTTLCKLCSSLNIIEFQICDRPVAGIPYFSTFWCWLVFCVQLGGLRQAFTCLREELVNLSSTS